MSDNEKLSHVEELKENSRQLRGTIAEELRNDLDHLSGDACSILKHHGSYQQDNRDDRAGGKSYMYMVRSRIPGGKVTAEQILAELDLCDRFGNGTLRVTTRQGLQLHGVVRGDLKATIRAINDAKLSTLAACGDVSRNVMCCPAPYKNSSVHDEMQAMADKLADHLKPRTTGYYEIWLTDENGESTDVTEFKPVEEPIYGTRYLPRKFKCAFAFPEDNCVDIYSNDLGFLAIVENDRIIGYNVLVGGSMGKTPALKRTFPAVAKRMTFVTPDQVLAVAEAIVKVQRDFGNRADRKIARMKYLIADWGIEKFKAKVEEYFGAPLPECHPADVTDVDDHIGWHEQGDGKWFLGINIDNGRIKDEGELRLKTALRTIFEKYRIAARLTPLQAIILCDVPASARGEIDAILASHGVQAAHELSLLRRYAMACPALPTCGLAVTESERVMPDLVEQIETEWARHGLNGERVSIHMTGCPNGCARPYTPDIGLVGKSRDHYTLFLGGNVQGSRLAYLYKDQVPFSEIARVLSPIIAYYKADRKNNESFGDFCFRKGEADIRARTEPLEGTAGAA